MNLRELLSRFHHPSRPTVPPPSTATYSRADLIALACLQDHDGSDDLHTYPPLTAELTLAAQYLATGDRVAGIVLYEACGSEARACAVAEHAYLISLKDPTT